ncbi:hypothetical protein [Flexithrix dorotheae]|uniref:hypothetical protein n=1 Tax=Flexithrix dorotheae TaxID=70993 RepID=UPI0003641D08|nr:hypothetical protein [Flexithrix dorotheae]
MVLDDYEFPENCKILDETINFTELDLSIDLEKLTALKLENDQFELKTLIEQKEESFKKIDSQSMKSLKYELISEHKFPEIWRNDNTFKGVIMFGQPFFSINAKYAYIECFYKCRGDCGFQVGVVYKKEKNGWKKWKELYYGIS